MVYRADIDGLRAIAVLSIVIFHISPSSLPGGFVGVDIFFVISGYLVCSMLQRDIDDGRFSIVSFYERRARRLLPALMAMLVVTYSVAFALYMPIDFRGFSASVVSTLTFSSNFFFWWNTDYFAVTAAYKPLTHTWSLAVEEQYYIVFPLLLLLLNKYWKKRTVTILLALALASLAASIVQVRYQPQAAFYLPFARFWELLAGALIAVGAGRRFVEMVGATPIALAGALLIGLSLAVFDEHTPFPGESALLPVLGAAMLIYAGQTAPTVVSRVLSNDVLTWTGKISYSLYLVHWPILAFFRYSYGKEPGLIEGAALFALMICLALACYYCVELPFRFRRQGLFARGPFAAGIGAIVMALCALGAVGYVSKGMPGRLDETTKMLSLAAYDTNPIRRRCDQMEPALVSRDMFCVEGEQSSADPSFALLGDSFGDALTPGILEAATRSGQKGLVLTYSSCYPLVGLRHSETCSAFIDAAIDAIKRQRGIRTVFIVSRWTSAYHATRFGEQKETDWFITDDLSPGPSYDETKKVFERSLIRTLEKLDGYDVVLVHGIPEQDRNVPRVLGVASHLGLPPYAGVTRQTHQERQDGLRAVFERAKQVRPFREINIGENLCSGTYCPVIRDDVVLYSDDNHLSRSGALGLGNLFDTFFRYDRWSLR